MLNEWIRARLEKRYGPVGDEVRVEDLGLLPIGGTFVVWHPLDDIYSAPIIAFDAPPRVAAISLRGELAGYALTTTIEPTNWQELGDASTDCDRFFLVSKSDIELAIDWFNEALLEFEKLGGNSLLETVVHNNGCTLAVVRSPDGNAKVFTGTRDTGTLAAALLEV